MKSPIFTRSLVSKHFTSYQEAMDEAITEFLAATLPLQKRKSQQRMESLLIHPRLIRDCSLLSPINPLKKEALIVSDAFEAVTNGMETRSIFESLEAIAEDSPFGAWKHFILAIHFFYSSLDEAVAQHWNKIPAHSPLRAFQEVWNYLLEPSLANTRPPVYAVGRLLDEVYEAEAQAAESLQLLVDSIETEQEEAFWSALSDLLEALSQRSSSKAQSAVIWVWNQLGQLEFDEENLLEISASLWGRPEAFRLAALGCLTWDPEGAHLLWGRYLLAGLRSDELYGDQLKAAVQLVNELGAAVQTYQLQQGPSTTWQENWRALVKAWNAETALRGLKAFQLSDESEPTNRVDERKASGTMATNFGKPHDGQLELFA